jgi:Flp pilus assembly protein TadG
MASVSSFRTRSQRGQSITEMALVLPLLLLVLGLGTDAARAFFMTVQITGAAREGALYAAHHASDALIDTHTQAVIAQEEQGTYPLLQCSATVPASIARADGSAQPLPTGTKTEETITVTCPFKPLLGFVPIPAITLKAVVTSYVFN